MMEVSSTINALKIFSIAFVVVVFIVIGIFLIIDWRRRKKVKLAYDTCKNASKYAGTNNYHVCLRCKNEGWAQGCAYYDEKKG